ncbi:MAG: hydratase [Oscillospiraceae bacterium]
MVTLHENGVFLYDGRPTADGRGKLPEEGAKKTLAYSILSAHDQGGEQGTLRVRFDSLISHDITYVGIIQTAKGSGLERFPVPYVMTNCHNSLCAVGGTINADDHAFGLSAAKKYGGIFVPPNMAVIHQYAREELAGCGRMILGSDSHTRYGALGTMGVGEGGPELVKQLLGATYDVAYPKTVLVYLTGTPRQGVGPHDVAVALCGAVYKNGFVKNKVLEFVGPGVKVLPMDFRIGIDVMTTETACLSSIWQTDERVEEYYAVHGRPECYEPMEPEDGAYYDSLIEIDLSKVEPMIAMPFHPSEAYTIHYLQDNLGDILRETEKSALEKFEGKVSLDLMSKVRDGRLLCDQGIIAGCSGGMYDNIAEAAAILEAGSIGSGYFALSVYPPSIPVAMELMENGVTQRLTQMGAVFKPSFCGPCFGAGDVPANDGFSIRHCTRNFPNREGSKPSDGQLSVVALMDARSIAATARNGGVLTAATDVDYKMPEPARRRYDRSAYDKRVYQGFGKADPEAPLRFGPNITEWPKMPALTDDILIELASVIRDPVTTTDELIPSGDTSSYRSNPMKLATFALSRRDPEYVGRTEKIREKESSRAAGAPTEELLRVWELLGRKPEELKSCALGSAIFANKPGDGSAREQAASCQRVLGGCANFCYEFATKRYRSNCINWGMLPFNIDADAEFPYEPGDYVFVPGVRAAVLSGAEDIPAKVVSAGTVHDITLHLPPLTHKEREIILEGCLMNWYAAHKNG